MRGTGCRIIPCYMNLRGSVQVKGNAHHAEQSEAWGEVERLSADGNEGIVHLKAVSPLKRPVPFSELRSDPRRNRDADVQPVSAEVFNLVLARSRK